MSTMERDVTVVAIVCACIAFLGLAQCTIHVSDNYHPEAIGARNCQQVESSH